MTTPEADPTLFIVEAEPVRLVAAVPPRAITAYAFRARFSMGERVVLDLASVARADHTPAQALQAATVRVMLQDMASAAWIDLDAPSVAEGLEHLAQAGLLAPERAANVLSAPVRPEERPAVRA